MQPADGSPLKRQPEETAHLRKTTFYFSKLLSSCLVPQRKIPWEAPATLALQDELFMQDHHSLVHVKYKEEKCLGLGNGAAVTDGF